MENVSIDFEKIVRKAVQRHVVKEDAPKVVACIMRDYASADSKPDALYPSFEEVANAGGIKTAAAIFDEFLSDTAIEEYMRTWMTVEAFRVRFAAHLDSVTA